MKEIDQINYKEESLDKLKKLLKCRFVYISKSGDHSIKTAFKTLKNLNYNSLTIPDQGGWMNYEKFAVKNNLKVDKIKTNYGVIEKEEITKKVNAMIVQEPAGYFAEQKLIDGIRKHTGFLILDVSGSLGKSHIKRFKADIYLGSFNEWKPADIGFGGFIATDAEKINKLIKENLEDLDEKFDSKFYEVLYNKLKFLGKRYKLFSKECRKIKNDLKNYEILHEKDDGINVVVKYRNEKEKKEIIDYCTKNSYEYTECPRYIRVMENAISIEVKRL